MLHVARQWRCGSLRAVVGQPEVHLVDGAYQPHRFHDASYYLTSRGHAAEVATKVVMGEGYRNCCSATGGRASAAWLWTVSSASRDSVRRFTEDQW